MAGRNYGAGSSRDWAAKGLRLLGVKAVIAEGFERIHRSNLVGMGVLPISLSDGVTRADLALGRDDLVDISLPEGITEHAPAILDIRRANGTAARFAARLDVLSPPEVKMIQNGGVLPGVLSGMGLA